MSISSSFAVNKYLFGQIFLEKYPTAVEDLKAQTQSSFWKKSLILSTTNLPSIITMMGIFTPQLNTWSVLLHSVSVTDKCNTFSQLSDRWSHYVLDLNSIEKKIQGIFQMSFSKDYFYFYYYSKLTLNWLNLQFI